MKHTEIDHSLEGGSIKVHSHRRYRHWELEDTCERHHDGVLLVTMTDVL